MIQVQGFTMQFQLRQLLCSRPPSGPLASLRPPVRPPYSTSSSRPASSAVPSATHCCDLDQNWRKAALAYTDL